VFIGRRHALFGAVRRILVALALLASGRPLAAQEAERTAYIIRLGADTFAVERFTRTAERLEGDLVLRAPRTRHIHYSALLAPDGSITRAELVSRPLAGQGRTSATTMTFTAAGTIIETKVGDSTRTAKAGPGAGAFPFINGGYAFYDAMLRRARRGGESRLRVPMVAASGNAIDVTVQFLGPDSVLVDYFGDPAHVRLDHEGRIARWDGTATTSKLVFERATDVDVDVEAMARTFAARDSGGQGMGMLSPRDTLRASVGAVQFLVDYGRPAKRGREIFGGIEPWGRVWRTGANAATQLETTGDLDIGGVRVPRGKYTLWTWLDPKAPLLIVNAQVGHWGTEYDPKKDVVRIPLAIERLAEPVERFTIGLDRGRLTLDWDRTRFAVPVVAR
jgi:hypothetical protein